MDVKLMMMMMMTILGDLLQRKRIFITLQSAEIIVSPSKAASRKSWQPPTEIQGFYNL